MADIKTLSPQRQDVVFSGGTDHHVRGGSVKLVVTVPQPTVTGRPGEGMSVEGRRGTSPRVPSMTITSAL